MTPAAAIRAARLRAGLTQQQAADLAGMAQPHWARLESGNRTPSMAMLERVAAALGCEVAVLLVQLPPGPPPLPPPDRDEAERLLRQKMRHRHEWSLGTPARRSIHRMVRRYVARLREL